MKVQIDKKLYKDIQDYHANIIRHLLINIDKAVIDKNINKANEWIEEEKKIINNEFYIPPENNYLFPESEFI